MDTARAAAYVQNKLKGITGKDDKIRVVNECIRHFAMEHQYFVRCPLTGLPLKGINITTDPNRGGEAITYHIPPLKARA